jgi:hypothetical protein
MKGYKQHGLRTKGTKLIVYPCGCIYQFRKGKDYLDFVALQWCHSHANDIWRRFGQR